MPCSLVSKLITWANRRAPDLVIGSPPRPYLRRWFVLPRNPLFNIYLHQFLRSDDDRALHDHPWLFNASWLLSGEYFEHTIKAGGVLVCTHRRAGDVKVRWGAAPHRVELLTVAHHVRTQPENDAPLPCWTLFITGPRYRQWGFHCPDQGWVHWKRFTAAADPGAVQRGCEQ